MKGIEGRIRYRSIRGHGKKSWQTRGVRVEVGRVAWQCLRGKKRETVGICEDTINIITYILFMHK